jgi:hypothetical protein
MGRRRNEKTQKKKKKQGVERKGSQKQRGIPFPL